MQYVFNWNIAFKCERKKPNQSTQFSDVYKLTFDILLYPMSSLFTLKTNFEILWSSVLNLFDTVQIVYFVYPSRFMHIKSRIWLLNNDIAHS